MILSAVMIGFGLLRGLSLPGALPPEPPVRLCAEWEPSLGTLIRWPLGIPAELVVGLAEEDSLYILVESPSQQAEAEAAFLSWGVNLDHCRFIEAETWSHWTRDWGPHWAFDGGEVCGIVDPVFDGYPWIPGGPYRDYMRERGYEEDDAVNAALAAELGCPLHEFPAYLTGGNFMTDGHGNGFSTLAMLSENTAFWTHEEFLSLAGSWLGLESYFITVNPEEYGIQHIDCAAKLLDEETLLIKEVPSWHPDYPRLETFCDQLTTAMSCYGRPYEIVRIQCDPYSGDEVAAYTNSYILNTRVFVPLFGVASDSLALATYAQAMPGYEIIGIPSGSWYYYDALHCRTREMSDPGMLLLWHMPYRGEVPFQDAFPVALRTRAYSGAGLVEGAQRVFWRVQGEAWTSSTLVPVGPDSLVGQIPGQPPGTILEYYLTAGDSSGRQESHPRSAPAGWHTFEVVDPEGVADPEPLTPILRVHPNPSSASVVLSLELTGPSRVTMEVLDLAGHLVDTIGPLTLGEGSHEVPWCPATLASGCYLIRLLNGTESVSARVVLVR